MLKEFKAWLRGAWIKYHLSDQDLTGGCLNPNDEGDPIVEAMVDAFVTGHANTRKEAEVVSGNFVYYVVDEGTNARKTADGDTPTIYATRSAAEYDCIGFDKVISVAAYNRIYGLFMSGE